MKRFVFIIFSISVFLQTQAQERIFVNGVIASALESDIEGVSIYNNMTDKGTVTNVDGKFLLEVKIDDELLISAIQYKAFKIIIDQKIIDTKKLGVYLNPSINELDEVILNENNLTGNILIDVQRIETVEVSTELFNLDYGKTRFNQDLSPDQQSSFKGNGASKAYYNNQEPNQLNLKEGFKWISRSIFKKKKKKPKGLTTLDKGSLITSLQQRFTQIELRRTFNIPKGSEERFLFFVVEEGFSKELLERQNELLLYSFLRGNVSKYLNQVYD